ncbi:NAD(P)H-binding protein [Marinobacterium jannaschii]|uniref:NAD(P)H-binding protein n=1 Tax=Marinobacterium jannaschii TaxID=64970 RepID=UPI0004844915|nr:NAD(P)H-binding protein [Marinobacterium jannaschii]
MSNRILVTGGTGKTGSRVAGLLRGKGLRPAIATRSPAEADQVLFNWRDPGCFAAAFAGIDAVYLVAPTDDFDSLGVMQPGLEAALKAGVQRFVLLSASSLEEGGPMMGAVHAWLRAHAPQWAVLRPSWFMQNLSEGQHCSPIRDEFSIFSATENGRMGWIAAEDIANCAATLLTAQAIENKDYILTGPQALSYDEVAAELSEQLGAVIEHKRLTAEQMAERFRNNGLPDDYAAGLASMDVAISQGSEDRVTANVEAITGQAPLSVKDFIGLNLARWQA